MIFSTADDKYKNVHDAYAFSFKTLTGEEPMPLINYKGNVILLVNTASKCGFTKQYKELEELYKRYNDQGLVVIAVPCNDFGHQEPGTNDEIADFCKLNYGVSFPVTAKEKVSGTNAHPFYKWAKSILGFGTAPKWNFHKYLIDRQGKLINHFNSPTSPSSKRLTAAIVKALADN